MTEPEHDPTGFDVAEPEDHEVPQDEARAMPTVTSPGLAEDESAEAPSPDSGEVVLVTHEPHTFQVTPELAITSTGTAVPADKAEEYLETGRKYGVPVFKKED
jgi:hypothetical protein